MKANVKRKATGAPAAAVRLKGRPSSYTEELGQQICERVSTGKTLTEICDTCPEMPTRQAVYGWLQRFPEFAQGFEQARQMRAEHRSDELDRLTQAMLAGELDPNTGRVVADIYRWQMAREHPRRYGDSTRLEVKTVATTTMDRLLAGRRRILQADAAEAIAEPKDDQLTLARA